jgi:tetratricopeptide (TPR) repeat protein
MKHQETHLPPLLLPTVDAHRGLRGPYTAAGTIMRAVVPHALACAPKLVAAHETELLSVAPELRETVPAGRETLTSLAVPKERTRYYSPLRTLRLAHGLTEFLRDYVIAAGLGPVALVVERVDQADPTDQEFLDVARRRLHPAVITVVVRDAADGGADRAAAEGADLAAAYIAADGTSDDPALLAAYEALPAAERRRRHDERACELTASGEFSWRLGAIPYHAEHGSDPAQACGMLAKAADYCITMGFYHAAIDLAMRGLAITEWDESWERRWVLVSRAASSMAALGRTDEAERLYLEARASSSEPLVHMQIGYGLAMLYTRLHEPGRIDHQLALGWINQAVALARQLPDAKEREFHTVFNENGRALVEKHLGHAAEALRLVSEGLDRLDAMMDPGEHLLHRSVLRHNRGQVYAGLGRLDEAAGEFRAVIAADPNYPEYHFDLGNLLRRMGDAEAALAEYETAIRLSPPFPEVYYNRADTRAALGDTDGAIADFGYVLELDPAYVDAHVNLAGLLLQSGADEAADRVVTVGLAVEPGHPALLGLRGRLDLEAGRMAAARHALDAAVAADPEFAEGWATRGTLSFETGDLTGALADLSRALEITADAALLFNRAVVHRALERWDAAIDDLSAALDLDPAEADAWLERARCRAGIGDAAGAAADALRFATLAPDRVGEADDLLLQTAGAS